MIKKKMVKLCAKIPAELDRRLRRFLEMRRGELSKFIIQAIEEKLEKEAEEK